MTLHMRVNFSAALLLVSFFSANNPLHAAENTHSFNLTITSDLPDGNVPFDPTIDFAKIIADAKLPGVLDPNSIEVVNKATGKAVPFARTEDFAYGDCGRLEWPIKDPTHKNYEIRFKTVARRPALVSQDYTPLVGVGDLLRYNAGKPRPIAMPYPARLVDLTGDGKPDYVGSWNYAYRDDSPWDGIICYPGVGDPQKLEFGDLLRVRYVDKADSTNFRNFSKIYMSADVADINGDGLVDVIYSPSGGDELHLYLNSGKRDTGNMSIFVAAGSIPRHGGNWSPCRVVDLDGDGLVDFIAGNVWIKNTSKTAKQWPIAVAKGVKIDVGNLGCFYDVDSDGRLDAVCLEELPNQEGLSNFRVSWRRNISKPGDAVPTFAKPLPLDGIDAPYPNDVIPVVVGGNRGLFVMHDHYLNTTFFKQTNKNGDKPVFESAGKVQSRSAVVSLSDQAWPWACDWDDDGDTDLLVGGGYGWPRIVINEGTPEKMELAESQYILSEGKPIRITRDEVLGPPEHWHDMGYSYPSYVDWDADGLPDLMMPNETNRIFWYKNIGTRKSPRFGPRQQVICDGFPDSPELRTLSAKRAGDKKSNNGCYPYEKERPFMWRTGAAFADWNGDGLMDMVTHDGHKRKATLFSQYRDKDGKLRLRRDGHLKLSDGRLIDDSIVNRSAHWTESFRPVDWDGDGLMDIMYSVSSGHVPSISLLKNVGSKKAPVFAPPRTMSCYGKPIKVTNHGPNAFAGDLDGDGKPDILTCVEWSVYPFFGYNALEMKERPSYEISPVLKP
ncbi:MAG: VCBS repeat-containing protein [Pirellulales bacterium]|nr:VCBS repeat-containing protein [Pirellulales bacterium]